MILQNKISSFVNCYCGMYFRCATSHSVRHRFRWCIGSGSCCNGTEVETGLNPTTYWITLWPIRAKHQKYNAVMNGEEIRPSLSHDWRVDHRDGLWHINDFHRDFCELHEWCKSNTKHLNCKEWKWGHHDFITQVLQHTLYQKHACVNYRKCMFEHGMEIDLLRGKIITQRTVTTKWFPSMLRSTFWRFKLKKN